MDVLGIVFVGSRTDERSAMATFLRDRLGLQPTGLEGADVDAYALPDGSLFAVADIDSDDGEQPERTVGFEVRDLDAAVAELRAAGVEIDEPAAVVGMRYAHFRAPDGRLYELVERTS